VVQAVRTSQWERSAETKADILDAARALFAERGFEPVTVDEIAVAAGCSKGAFYYHFKTKEEARRAVIAAVNKQRPDLAKPMKWVKGELADPDMAILVEDALRRCQRCPRPKHKSRG
jgi:AcrR family transcriptional regulator